MKVNPKPALFIGIDPGTATGLAIGYKPNMPGALYADNPILLVGTYTVHNAIFVFESMFYGFIKRYGHQALAHNEYGFNTVEPLTFVLDNGGPIEVHVEDARQIGGRGKNDYLKAQGAGSIKRDCSIWEGYLADLSKKVPLTVVMRRPYAKNPYRKMSQEAFNSLYGKPARVTNHARDAFGLIVPYIFSDKRLLEAAGATLTNTQYKHTPRRPSPSAGLKNAK